jgi:hypothetical protein
MHRSIRRTSGTRRSSPRSRPDPLPLRGGIAGLRSGSTLRIHTLASTVESVLRTASCQPRHLRSRVCGSICGEKRRSSFQVLAKPSKSGHNPALRPARYAAPSAVVSEAAKAAFKANWEKLRAAGNGAAAKPARRYLTWRRFFGLIRSSSLAVWPALLYPRPSAD